MKLKLKVWIAFLLLALAGCGKEQPEPVSGDGSSIEQAVVIKGAKTQAEGVEFEQVWLVEHFPGSRERQQTMLVSHGRKIDEVEITAHEGLKTVYFDITDSFGK